LIVTEYTVKCSLLWSCFALWVDCISSSLVVCLVFCGQKSALLTPV